MVQKSCTEHHTRQENLLKKKTVEAQNYKGVIRKDNLVNTGIRYANRFRGKELVLDIQGYTKLVHYWGRYWIENRCWGRHLSKRNTHKTDNKPICLNIITNTREGIQISSRAGTIIIDIVFI